MREIKFRGMDANNKWYYGDLEYNAKYDVARIHTYKKDGEYDKQHLVCPDTIGQFTGLKDKNGVEIYEGDLVKRSFVDSDISRYYKLGIIAFDIENACFVLNVISEVYDSRKLPIEENEKLLLANGDILDGQTPVDVEYQYVVIGNKHEVKEAK